MIDSPYSIKPALQSIVNATTGQVIGYEVLARWTEGWMNDALPMEKINSPVTIDWRSVDRKIIESLLFSTEHMAQLEGRFFINVSNDTLINEACFSYWKSKLLDLLWLVNLPITIEIVESIEDTVLESRWEEFERLGVTLALDDFGKQNSTLDRLKRYEWSFCKIDIKEGDITQEALEFCQTKSISVIAEQVESEFFSQKAFERGLDQHQGFLYGLPFFLRGTKNNEKLV
mgnify:FL=1